MKPINFVAIFLLSSLALAVSAEDNPADVYKNWSHSDSFFIITNPDGANIPDTASETDFPLLVRLNKISSLSPKPNKTATISVSLPTPVNRWRFKSKNGTLQMKPPASGSASH